MSIPKISDYEIQRFSHQYTNTPNWKIDSRRTVLLIHDMQNHFIKPFQRDGTVLKHLTSSISEIKQHCAQLSIPCLYTAQPADQSPTDRSLLTDFWGPGLKGDNTSSKIISAIKPTKNDQVFTKWRYSAFKKNTLHQWMEENERDQMIICGVYGHIGILATALDAFMMDYQAFVVADAVADFSEADHARTMDYIAQRCGVVVSRNDITSLAPSLHRKESGLTKDEIKRDVAEILHILPDDISDTENLQFIGLDSIRLISLIEKWQCTGISANFSDLAENMTIAHWCNITQREQKIAQVS